MLAKSYNSEFNSAPDKSEGDENIQMISSKKHFIAKISSPLMIQRDSTPSIFAAEKLDERGNRFNTEDEEIKSPAEDMQCLDVQFDDTLSRSMIGTVNNKKSNMMLGSKNRKFKSNNQIGPVKSVSSSERDQDSSQELHKIPILKSSGRSLNSQRSMRREKDKVRNKKNVFRSLRISNKNSSKKQLSMPKILSGSKKSQTIEKSPISSGGFMGAFSSRSNKRGSSQSNNKIFVYKIIHDLRHPTESLAIGLKNLFEQCKQKPCMSPHRKSHSAVSFADLIKNKRSEIDSHREINKSIEKLRMYLRQSKLVKRESLNSLHLKSIHQDRQVESCAVLSSSGSPQTIKSESQVDSFNSQQ